MATNGGCRCQGARDHLAGAEREQRMKLREGIHLLRYLADLPGMALALQELARQLRGDAYLREAREAVLEAALVWDDGPGIRDGETQLSSAVSRYRAIRVGGMPIGGEKEP